MQLGSGARGTRESSFGERMRRVNNRVTTNRHPGGGCQSLNMRPAGVDGTPLMRPTDPNADLRLG